MSQSADHNEIIDRIPEYAAGALSAAERSEVEVHLAGCADCRQWLEECRTVFADLIEVERLETSSHPSAERLALYAADASRLPASEREQLGIHLDFCAPCRGELATYSELNQAVRLPAPALSRPGGFSRLRRLLWHPGVAYALAGAAVLILAITQRPGVMLRGGIEPPAIATDALEHVIRLPEQTRSSLAAWRIEVEPEQTAVRLGLKFPYESGREYVASVVDHDGRTLFQAPVSRAAAEQGFAVIRLSTATLASGDYTAAISAAVPGGDTHSVFYPFTIIR